jgi:hypothetical protein
MMGPEVTWTNERIGRLGFFIGLGWDAIRIARDPVINTTPNNVFRQAKRFGLSFRAAAAVRKIDVFSAAAAAREISVEELMDRLIREIEDCPTLIDNVLDDGIA